MRQPMTLARIFWYYSVAEKAAALVLALSAALIVFNETLWNWQAVWLAALLAAVALACRRAPAARSS